MKRTAQLFDDFLIINSIYPIAHFPFPCRYLILVPLIWRLADFSLIKQLRKQTQTRQTFQLPIIDFYHLTLPYRLSPSIIQLATWIMERSSLHALGSLVLDFPLFTFFFNVLSKRQFRIRNLSANTAINDFYQSTPHHSLRTVLSLSLRWLLLLLLLLFTSAFALHRIASHCSALHSLSTRE